MKKSYLLSAAICFSFFVGILSSDKVLAQREISTGIEEIVVTAQKKRRKFTRRSCLSKCNGCSYIRKNFCT